MDDARVSEWKDPNDSSSPIKSTLPFGAAPGTGKERACGNGEGGAGHRPGAAAARSMRLNVWRCCAALTFFSPGRATLIDW